MIYSRRACATLMTDKHEPGRLGTGPAGVPPEALDALKDTEPWAVPSGDRTDPDVPAAVADALERTAERVRAGDVILPADARVTSDASALALALAAMLARRADLGE